MAFLTKFAVLAASAASAAAGIYPDDHWSYATKLTTSNYVGEIKTAVDSGKTMVAPEWNKVVKDFANDDTVVFGDVILREDRITTGPDGGALSPGKGGWPTVRYFNSATGYDGAPYEKKSSDAMCTELGPNKPFLTDFVKGLSSAGANSEL